MNSDVQQDVVANALCYLDNTSSSFQLSLQGERNRIALYLNCSIVSLRSALLHNPAIAAVLVVNFDIPARRREEIERLGIAIQRIEFVTFRMPDAFP